MEMAESCFIVALAWVGRLFVIPISKFYILESLEHKAQVDALKGAQVQQCVELFTLQPGILWREISVMNTTRHVIWKCTPAELRIVSISDEDKEPTIIRNWFIKMPHRRHLGRHSRCRRNGRHPWQWHRRHRRSGHHRHPRPRGRHLHRCHLPRRRLCHHRHRCSDRRSRRRLL